MIDRVLDWTGYRCINLSERLKGHTEMIEHWKHYIADDPYELKRITYPFDASSLVLDVGGYKGEWAMRMHARYNCRIHIFEPYPVHAAYLRLLFAGQFPNVTVSNTGLGDTNEVVSLYGDDIYASVYEHPNNTSREVIIRRASDVLEEYDERPIDLLKLNVEGSEYKILPNLIANYPISTIMNIQVQFHNTVPGYKKKREEIQYHLKKTHRQTWNYEWQYENWAVKP